MAIVDSRPTRRLAQLTLLLAATTSLPSCVAANEPAASPPAPSAPPPSNAEPSPAALEGAPECVLAMAKTRRCFVDYLIRGKPTRNGQFSCPDSPVWGRADLRLDSITVGLPHDLSHAWDKRLRCTLQFKEPMSEEQLAALEAAGTNVSLEYASGGKLAYGTVELSHLYCLAELGIVSQLECEQPPPVLQ